MNSIVCIKQVPDTEIQIEIEDGQVVEEKLQYVINPYDEYAIEEALRLREKFGEGRVTVLTLGPERAREAIMQALAVGADEAIHLVDEAFQGGDAYATAKALAEAIVRLDLGYDIILCGKQGVDHDFGAERAPMPANWRPFGGVYPEQSRRAQDRRGSRLRCLNRIGFRHSLNQLGRETHVP